MRRQRSARVGSAARLIRFGDGLGVGVEQQFHHTEQCPLGGGVVQGQLSVLRIRGARRSIGRAGQQVCARRRGRRRARRSAAAAWAAWYVQSCAPHPLLLPDAERLRRRGWRRAAALSPQKRRPWRQRSARAAFRPARRRAWRSIGRGRHGAEGAVRRRHSNGSVGVGTWALRRAWATTAAVWRLASSSSFITSNGLLMAAA